MAVTSSGYLNTTFNLFPGDNGLLGYLGNDGLNPLDFASERLGIVTLGLNGNNDDAATLVDGDVAILIDRSLNAVNDNQDGYVLITSVGDGNLTLVGGRTDKDFTAQILEHGGCTLNGELGDTLSTTLAGTVLVDLGTAVLTAREVGDDLDFAALELLIGLNNQNHHLVIVAGSPLGNTVHFAILRILSYHNGNNQLGALTGDVGSNSGLIAELIQEGQVHVCTLLHANQSYVLGQEELRHPCTNIGVEVSLNVDVDIFANLILSDLIVLANEILAGVQATCHQDSSKSK